MAAFNRERVPDRQPHAKGSGAFDRFEVTEDVSADTKAAVFQPGTTTETVIRFATVAGERGSPDTWRHMNLYSAHTYMWVNAAGDKFWVKYHFMTDQGIENHIQSEADQLVSLDTDFHTRDLFQAIERSE